MAFGDDNFEKILPPYLVEPDKSRLRESLKQFIPDGRRGEINYENFYRDYNYAYFMQSDLVREVRFAEWDEGRALYDKKYTDAIIISNTCDVSIENSRDINTKQCLFAPLIDFNLFLSELKNEGYSSEKVNTFSENVKSQLCTNIFYLPQLNKEGKEYIVLLDNVFWFPTSELNSYIEEIEENRISSLALFGFYLFILKLSFHLCRLPEQCDRELKVNL